MEAVRRRAVVKSCNTSRAEEADLLHLTPPLPKYKDRQGQAHLLALLIRVVARHAVLAVDCSQQQCFASQNLGVLLWHAMHMTSLKANPHPLCVHGLVHAGAPAVK